MRYVVLAEGHIFGFCGRWDPDMKDMDFNKYVIRYGCATKESAMENAMALCLENFEIIEFDEKELMK